jgi:DNA-binding transcriptional ArsR family regulator
MNKIEKHLEAYKQALREKNETTIFQEKAWLREAVAWALLHQDEQTMKIVRAFCADLAPLTDLFDETAKGGDCWRYFGEVLSLFLENNKPLAQLRCALPNTVSGKILKEIQAQAGITPSALCKRLSKSDTHISNELKKLEKAGLIYRFRENKSYELFLSVLGKEALDSVTPECI